MKHLSILLSALFLLSLTTLYAQRKSISTYITPSGKKVVNTKVDNMFYWKNMVKLGYAKADPYKFIPKPVFRSSVIQGDGLLVQDSPDVPVTGEASTTQSENSIFVDPNNEDVVFNSNNSTDWTSNYAGVLYGCDNLWSSNSGITWGGTVYGTAGSNSGDPTTAIGRNGWWYNGMINNAYGQSVAYSTNQGASWTEVVCSASPGGFNILDKNHLWIDNKVGSPYQGNLYNAWTNFVSGSPSENNIEINRTTNQGLNWGSPINISAAVNAGSHNQGVNVNTGPNGEVYAIWAVYDGWPTDESAIGFAKSLNGGATFTSSTRIINDIRGIRTTGTSKDMRVNSFPCLTVDISGGPNNGTLYVVWANIGYPGVNTGSDIDIYMIKSTTQGLTWSAPVKVNQDASGLGNQHYMPWITCDPENGNLAVVYYDDRNVASTQCETWVSYSYDGGTTWQDIRVSDVAFTPSPISGLATGYFGDYLGITSKNMKVYPVWTDNRSGREMTYVSPFNLGPQPNQPYVVYNSVDVVTLGGTPGQTMNYGDSVHLTIGLKNIGDQPTTNVNAFLSTSSSYVTITDSSAFYDQFIPGEIKSVPMGYTIKVSDSIPDGMSVRFKIRSTDGDSTWYSHFSLEAHAPALVITKLTVKDSLFGNNNHRMDPGEVVTAIVTTANTGDFDCLNTWGKLTTNSPLLTIESDSVYLGTLAATQSKDAAYTVSVSDESGIGTGVALTFTATSGRYDKTRTFQETIGIVDEDWETHTFTKFPWYFGGDVGWFLTNVDPYEGIYSARSGIIYDQQDSELNLIYTSAVDDSISFYLKTSSEPSYDFLYFFIDNILMDQWSGENPWQRAAYPVTAGTHIYRWEYFKDIFLSVGSDCAWVDFIEFPPPVLPTVNAGPYDTICAGQTYQLQGEAANYDSIKWTTYGDGTFSNDHILSPVYTPGTSDVLTGSVRLKLTAYGISGSAPSHMYLTISGIPTALLSGQKNICSGETTSLEITLTGTPPWQVTMNPQEVLTVSSSPYTYSVSPMATTTYSIASVSGLHGCVGTASGSAQVTVNPLPTVDITLQPNDTLCTWQTLNLASNASGAATFLWTPGNKTTADISVEMATLGGTGDYWIKLAATSANNCTSMDSVKIYVKECVGISEKELNFASEVYPNPCNGRFTLNLYAPLAESINVRLINESGAVLFHDKNWNVAGKAHKAFDFKKLAEGVYYLELERNEGKVTHKMVISR
jgi:hypothetical protein